ncbi:hypothetical protein JOD67_006894 [Tenggerimyces flavus]|nr:hypothetical protein [Tenggerimyces flavus]
MVRVATELDWYCWATDPDPARPKQCPHSKPWPAALVWAE